jgi:hypothetical protein
MASGTFDGDLDPEPIRISTLVKLPDSVARRSTWVNPERVLFVQGTGYPDGEWTTKIVLRGGKEVIVGADPGLVIAALVRDLR